MAISHDYYTRIAQGRLAPSEPVLAAIAHTLRLTADQQDYVEGLARQAEGRTPPQRPSPVRPQLQRLLDQLTDTPAFIVGKYLDILAWNGLVAALLTDLDTMPERDRNYVRWSSPTLGCRPSTTTGRPWRAAASPSCAGKQATTPTDPRLAALVGEMSVNSPQFRRWWADRHVARPDFGTKTIRHPDLGELTLDWDAFAYTGDPDQQLVLWSAEPGSSSHDKLRILNSWTAPSGASRTT